MLDRLTLALSPWRGVVHRLVVLCGLLASSPASASGPVGAIEIAGNQRIASETIRFHLNMQPGAVFDPAKANAAIKALYATGQFADVRIEQTGAGLRVTVVENPSIGKVAFEGQSALDEKALKDAAKLNPREPYTRTVSDDAIRRLRSAYEAKGHPDAAIEIKTAPAAQNRVDVTFVIREHATAKVEAIGFTGNTAFTDGQLRDVITTRQAGWFDFLQPTTAPVDDRLDLDRSLLVRHYQKHGFADVRVGAAERTRDPQSQQWRISFAVDEGSKYAVGTIGVQSQIPGVATYRLRDRIVVKTGGVWSPDAVETSIERMTEGLIEAGHVGAQVLAKPERDPASRNIGVDFRISLGPRLVIDRIEITGNSWTRERVIRRELRFVEGDVFQPLLIERARKRLMGLGVFKSVEIRKTAGREPDRVVVGIAIVEQPSGDVGFGVGYSSTEGIVGDVSFTERNLFGQGQALKLKLAGSATRAEGEVSFTEPYFLGVPLAAGFDLFYKNADLSQASSYKSTRYGGDIRLGAEIAPNTRATVNYTLSRNTLYDVAPDASAAIRQATGGASSAAYTTSSVGYAVAYDTRGYQGVSKTNPVSGVMISTSQDLAGLGGDVRYLRTLAEARAYFPLTDKITLATRATGGTISGWGGSEVRLLDMFNRGGETVRGFATGGIGPRDTASRNQDALGGTNFLATTAELRAPVPFVPEEIGLRGAIFADAGSLWGSTKSVKSTTGVVGTTATLRASVGAGLIWDSPIGPLRVDYAQPIAKQPFDKTQNLRFGLVPGF